MSRKLAPHSRSRKSHRSSLAFVLVGLVFGLMFSAAIVESTFDVLDALLMHRNPQQEDQSLAHAAQNEHVYLNLNILLNQPGMQKDWPGYSNTNLVVPANSLVTITIHNYDLGDTPLPDGSPFTRVQGTQGGIATSENKPYSSLAFTKIAHTFTVPLLNLNVPIPGDAPAGATYTSVTFTFHTGKAGTYIFRCFAPCGTGTSGWMGPMLTKGYMIGTLTVR